MTGMSWLLPLPRKYQSLPYFVEAGIQGQQNYCNIFIVETMNNNGKNGVATFSRLFLLGSISYLQVTGTYMRAWMSLKFGQIRLLVPSATDKVIMEKTVLPLFLCCYLSDPFHTCR